MQLSIRTFITEYIAVILSFIGASAPNCFTRDAIGALELHNVLQIPAV